MSNALSTHRFAPAGSPLARHFWRTLAVVSLLALVPATPAVAQWSIESPLPTRLQIHGIAAPAPGRIFLATDDDSLDNGGALFESGDGGDTWVQRDIPLNLQSGLNGIFFLDSQHGWAWGNVNYRTLDGGTTWEELPVLGSAYFMEFSTPDFGVTTGNFGTLVSRDGGLTWEPSPQDMTAFSFADATRRGSVLGATGLFRTTNGGADFASVFAGDADAVAFLSPIRRGGDRRRRVRAIDQRRRDLGDRHQRRGSQPTVRRFRRRRAGVGSERHIPRTTMTASSAPPMAARPGTTSAK